MNTYVTYICDELGCPLDEASRYSEEELKDILRNHPEWTLRTLAE